MHQLARELMYDRPSPIQADYPEAKIDPAVTKVPKNFQLLLDQFSGGLRFKRLLKASASDINQFLYKIETLQGLEYFILETDYLENFRDLRDQMEQLFSEKLQFIDTLHSPVSFFDCPPARFYVGDRAVPRDFDLTKQYFNWRHGTEDYYFTFLFKLENQPLPYEQYTFEEPKHGVSTTKQDVPLPYHLVSYLRLVYEDIQARRIITLVPSIALLKCECAFGGLTPQEGIAVLKDTYKFTYFPTFAVKDKPMTCRWVLYLTKQQIEDIARGKAKTWPLWACSEPTCNCKYGLVGMDCRHGGPDDQLSHSPSRPRLKQLLINLFVGVMR